MLLCVYLHGCAGVRVSLLHTSRVLKYGNKQRTPITPSLFHYPLWEWVRPLAALPLRTDKQRANFYRETWTCCCGPFVLEKFSKHNCKVCGSGFRGWGFDVSGSRALRVWDVCLFSALFLHLCTHCKFTWFHLAVLFRCSTDCFFHDWATRARAHRFVVF